ncbi:unnamed protein product [Notodromas monacha]|uniref:Tetratricopeptide repeat protein 39B n=1 Tax=Notodromas monacha TaxID=399045 RepID=A0A7R9BLS6_9CRUS|nr:unnamed protein product [Notodromas monacha]CAG0916976.1 unnamed protein product [Notodromas monacha]
MSLRSHPPGDLHQLEIPGLTFTVFLNRMNLDASSATMRRLILKKQEDRYKSELKDLNEGMEAAMTSTAFMLNNDIARGEALVKDRHHVSSYHAMAYGGLKTVQAVLTIDPRDIDDTSLILTTCIAACQRHRSQEIVKQQSSFGQFNIFKKAIDLATLTDPERHAELCFAEVTLYKTIISVSQDDSVMGMCKAVIQMRRCHNIFIECQSIINRAQWSSTKSKENFITGVKLGLGSFNLMLSLIPPKNLKMLQLIGLSGDRNFGHRELLSGFLMPQTVRTYTCGLILLMYHLYPGFIYSTGVGSANAERLAVVNQVIEKLMTSFPESSLVYYLRGRKEQLMGNLEESTRLYQLAIDRQTQLPSSHPAAFWEMLFNSCTSLDYDAGVRYADLLLKRSNWSKCTYCYMRAVLQYVKGNPTQKDLDEIKRLLREVPKLKRTISGKGLSFEEFAIAKSERYFAQGQKLIVPLVEVIYVFNGFLMLGSRQDVVAKLDQLVNQGRKEIDKIDKRDYLEDNLGLWHFMKGCLAMDLTILQFNPSLALDLAVLKFNPSLAMDLTILQFNPSLAIDLTVLQFNPSLAMDLTILQFNPSLVMDLTILQFNPSLAMD